MPVLVTVDDSPVGPETVRQLLGFGGEVRAFCTPAGDVAAVRSAGAITAAGDLLDEGHLEAAMEGVHTVVHLCTAPLGRTGRRLLEEAATVVTAALGARAQRLVVLSVAGAAADAADGYRRALGEVEDLLVRAPVPSVAVRASLVDTPALRDALAGLRPTEADLDATVAPVRPDDVAAVLVAADAARSTATDGHAVLSAEGPQRMTLADYLEHAGVGPPGRVAQLVGRVWRPPDEVALLAGALAGRWVEDESWVVDGFGFAGRQPRRVP